MSIPRAFSTLFWTQVQEEVVDLPIDCVERGFYQPREYFVAEAMEATRRSIQEKGQMYPVIVRPILAGNPLFDAAWKSLHFELADGERRYRCCKDLGHKTLRAIVRPLTDEQMLDYTLSTNDSLPLNPIERAQVYTRLATEFGKTQEEIAKSFNLKQQQVSEYIRLLELPKPVRDLTARAVISVRHARELLKVSDNETIENLALEVVERNLGTRELTERIKAIDLKKRVRKIQKIVKINRKNGDSSNEMMNIEENEAEKSLLIKDISRQVEDRKTNKILIPFSFLNRLLIPYIVRQKLSDWASYQMGWICSGEELIALGQLSVLLPALLGLGLYHFHPLLPALVIAMAGPIFLFIIIPLEK